MIKKLIVLFLCLAIAFGVAAPAMAAGADQTLQQNPFEDVAENAYYYDAVLWAVANRITAGTSATTFSPSKSCTRGELVTFLWRSKGAPEPTSTENPFSDVKKGAFYEKAVLWALENNITKGVDETHFRPDQSCTRAQVVTFLWRIENQPQPVSDNNPFVDVTGGYYFTAVLWAVGKGVTKGTDAAHFSPDAACTRGQIVTLLYRAAGNDGPDVNPEPDSQKVLVAYFSCTGNTERIAGYIADATGGASYQIMPEIPYTSADLNYNDSTTRATREQNDPSARPEISGAIADLENYDVIFLGYPIWWGQAPKIMYTFLESCDLTGKTVIPFCTSGSSPIGSSASNLQSAANAAGTWQPGRRFSGSASRESVLDWIKELGLYESAGEKEPT